MLPVVKGKKRNQTTNFNILLDTFFVSLLPYYFGFAEEQFLAFGIIINLIFLFVFLQNISL